MPYLSSYLPELISLMTADSTDGICRRMSLSAIAGRLETPPAKDRHNPSSFWWGVISFQRLSVQAGRHPVYAWEEVCRESEAQF